MLVVLRVRWGVVVVVVVVRRGILRAVLGMVAVVLGLHCVHHLRSVMQVGRVGLVRYESGVTRLGERRVALRRRFPSLAAKERPEDGSRCRVRDGWMAAGHALARRVGSPSCVWTANDGPLQEGKKQGNSASVRHCATAEHLH